MSLPLDDRSHRTVIGEALRDLNRHSDWRPDGYRLLAGGLSGSAVYAIQLAGEPVVLKVTPPTGPPVLLAQAQREAAFYRDLAPRIPLAVPRLLAASAPTSQCVAILLAASETAPPITSWTARQYTEVATQLGQLHGRFWGRTDRLNTFEWLRAAPSLGLAIRSDHASLAWQAIGERDDLDDGETPRRLRAVLDLVARLPALTPPPALPATLCHGDCHPENLLWGEAGGWIWADWQAVRIGQGPTDLTFFWQRTEMAGGVVPREAMGAAYRSGLETAGAVVPTAHQLDQALAWAELTSWLLDWPPFLADLSPERIELMLDRIDELTGRLAIDRAA